MPQVHATPANFDEKQMEAFLNNKDVRNYLTNKTPAFKGEQDGYGQRFDLTWVNAVTFSDGTNGTLHIHKHERSTDRTELDGGGAWGDGGALGNGVQVNELQAGRAIKKICTDWLNEHYGK